MNTASLFHISSMAYKPSNCCVPLPFLMFSCGDILGGVVSIEIIKYALQFYLAICKVLKNGFKILH